MEVVGIGVKNVRNKSLIGTKRHRSWTIGILPILASVGVLNGDPAGFKTKYSFAMATHVADRNQECTVWVGGLEPQTTEELLYELMLQVGPVVQLNMPRDAVTQAHQVCIGCKKCTYFDQFSSSI
jgi:hypothetical protein